MWMTLCRGLTAKKTSLWWSMPAKSEKPVTAKPAAPTSRYTAPKAAAKRCAGLHRAERVLVGWTSVRGRLLAGERSGRTQAVIGSGAPTSRRSGRSAGQDGGGALGVQVPAGLGGLLAQQVGEVVGRQR